MCTVGENGTLDILITLYPTMLKKTEPNQACAGKNVAN